MPSLVRTSSQRRAAELADTPPQLTVASTVDHALSLQLLGSAPPALGDSSQSADRLRSSSTAASLRNTTVLPEIRSQGAKVLLKPRREARYTRVKHLGRGGMGEVNMVLDKDIGRMVAKKTLRERTPDAACIAGFVDEIHTVGKLEHPNIVPIYDVGVDEQGQIFFLMKHVDGETLESVIKHLQAGDREYVDRYSIDARVEIFMGILRALAHAHEKGVLHRDLKPANVMVGRHGEVMLMDWGVAAEMPTSLTGPALRPATPEGTLVGTPAYMSPEQAGGRISEQGPPSDLYSATVLFHELLAGTHYLAHCTNLQKLLIAIQTERFPYRRLVFLRHPNLPVPPAELLHFIARGLHPRQRYQRAEEMLAELQRIREGRCRVSCPATLARRSINTVGGFVSHYPKLSPVVFFATVLLLLSYIVVSAALLHGRIYSGVAGS